ncbi:SGNH/GDSL hydrolase family protein [Pelomonas aquatica]|jgi:outer membrane lipase/esterase|nr:SGNH/GDSL hydrolase family protein [Pelomonas aquatica]MCY4753113.1 SGNH/GDSL hydrolase family protein [Pelomonas aquatica]
MKPFLTRIAAASAALMAGLLVAGCGGGATADTTPKFSPGSVVSFGDSLSDQGTYQVGTVAALGGGQYTVNGVGPSWLARIAALYGLAKPCPAQQGLDGLASQGFSVPVKNNAGCFAYGQGGSRVTNPVGPGNKLLGGSNAVLGQLTVPVVTQLQNHLAAVGGSYKGTELVFVYAGGNDVFINLATVQATIAAGGDPTAAATAGVTAMGQAGAELAGYVKALVVGKGAKNVVVINLPDVSLTPFAKSLPAATQGLILQMVNTFNDQLKGGLSGTDLVWVDAAQGVRDEIANPAKYSLANVTMPACDLSPAKNPLASSLVCNANNVVAGDVSHYLFADTVHPTPYGEQLLSQAVSLELARKGWL